MQALHSFHTAQHTMEGTPVTETSPLPKGQPSSPGSKFPAANSGKMASPTDYGIWLRRKTNPAGQITMDKQMTHRFGISKAHTASINHVGVGPLFIKLSPLRAQPQYTSQRKKPSLEGRELFQRILVHPLICSKTSLRRLPPDQISKAWSPHLSYPTGHSQASRRAQLQ